MTSHSVLPMKARLAPLREGSWRRTSHGGSAFSAEQTMLQPQDGAEVRTVSGQVSPINARARNSAEPEDARLTGSTRSLFRRLTGLNVMVATTPIVPTRALAVRKPSRLAAIVSTPQAQVA